MNEVLQFLADSTLPLSMVFTLLSIVMLAHLVVIQTKEAVTFKDYLTRYRYYILAFLVIFLATMIPVAAYLILRINGIESDTMRNLATLAGRFGPFCAVVALELVYLLKPRR